MKDKKAVRRKHSEETKRKISLAVKGSKNGNWKGGICDKQKMRAFADKLQLKTIKRAREIMRLAYSGLNNITKVIGSHRI